MIIKSKKGYITLLSVLIVGAIGLSVTTSLLLLGISSSRTSFSLEQSNQAKGLASACAEEALQQIRSSTSFSGPGNLSLGEGDCSYTVTNQGGENRAIEATGTVGTIVRKIEISINQINPTITVTSWVEVDDF